MNIVKVKKYFFLSVKSQIIDQVKFTYSLQKREFKKQKVNENRGKKQVKALQTY